MLILFKEDVVFGFTNSLKGFVQKRRQENVNFGITITEFIKLANGYQPIISNVPAIVVYSDLIHALPSADLIRRIGYYATPLYWSISML